MRRALLDVPPKLDVMTYLLQANKYPAGKAELTADSAGTILLVGKDGPKPTAQHGRCASGRLFGTGSWKRVDVDPCRRADTGSDN